MDDHVRAVDAMTDALTEKQKELFENYVTAQREVSMPADCERYIFIE